MILLRVGEEVEVATEGVDDLGADAKRVVGEEVEVALVGSR